MAPRRSRTTARDRSRRVLSQNFLADPAAVVRMLRAARPGPDDLLLEVGAGDGRLTRPLAARCGRLIAYEVDPAVLPGLTAACATLPQVRIRPADFLAAEPPAEPFAVVGNIPWSLTAAVVRWCLAAPGLRSATLLTQLAYARKRAGDHGRWSRLTVLTWPEHHWRLAGRVPRAAFRPVPAVDAASCASNVARSRCCPRRRCPRTGGWWSSASAASAARSRPRCASPTHAAGRGRATGGPARSGHSGWSGLAGAVAGGVPAAARRRAGGREDQARVFSAAPSSAGEANSSAGSALSICNISVLPPFSWHQRTRSSRETG